MSNAPLTESYMKKHKMKEHDPNYKGETLQEHYDVCDNGPQSRCCPTDIICCVLFLGFVVGMVILAISGLTEGNPSSILYPWDPDGRQCGVTEGFEDYKYVYWPATTSISNFCCVKSCPDGESATIECKTNSKVTTCDSAFSYETSKWIYTCAPSNAEQYADISGVFPDNAQQYMGDLTTGWKVELSAMFIALVIGYLYLIILRYFTGCMTWAIIVLYHIILVVIGVFCLTTSNTAEYQTTDMETSKKCLQAAAYTCWAVAVLTLLYVLCILKRIKIAIAILKAATEFSREYFFVMFVPLIIFVVYFLSLLFWLYGFLYVYTAGTPKTEVSFPYSGIDVDDTLRNSCIYFLIGLIWVSEWFVAYSFFVIAAMACIWYFQRQVKSGTSAFSSSICWGFVHTGSLAFGAAICTIVDILKIFLYYMHKMTDKDASGASAPAKCFLKCMICCAECFEAWLRYINRNAYIQMALTGKYFCKCAHNAFYLMFRNVNLFAATDGIGMVLIFFGKLFISCSTTAICYIILQYTDLSDELYSPVAPCLLIFVVSFFLAYMLLNIYGVAADSLLQCYCLDSEAAHAQGRQKHTPETLKEFVDQHE